MEVLQVFNSVCDLYTIRMLLSDISNQTDTIRERLGMNITKEGKEIMILEIFSKQLRNFSPTCELCEAKSFENSKPTGEIQPDDTNEENMFSDTNEDDESVCEECPAKLDEN